MQSAVFPALAVLCRLKRTHRGGIGALVGYQNNDSDPIPALQTAARQRNAAPHLCCRTVAEQPSGRDLT
jgi:hypothetical protein